MTTTAHSWVESGPEQVADHIHRLPLPLPLVGLRAVNAYVIEHADELVVLDPGWATSDSRDALARGLRSLGHDLRDVTSTAATHLHWDHYTEALALRADHGIPTALGAGESASIEAFDWSDGLHASEVTRLRGLGSDLLADRIAALPLEDYERDMPFDIPDRWLRTGDLVGGLQVLETPGHTRGHVVLHDPAAGVLLSGDHVLPGITPVVGHEGCTTTSPLADFLSSLRGLLELPDSRLLPGHGPVTESTHQRVRELLAHHDERLEEIAVQVRLGARTAEGVASRLPWTGRQVALADLHPTHQMLAVHEVAAHLVHLTELGLLPEHDGA